MSHDWQTKLAERGILEAALELDWHPNGNGWQYPVWANMPDGTPILRWKNYDSAARPKCKWIPGGADDELPYYYCPPDAPRAIAAQNGELYIASGEPDVLAYRAAGITNVLSFFGEGRVPDSLADDLRDAGVTKVFIYPDLDDAGCRWASAIAGKLAGGPVELHAYKLPVDRLGEKGDINKLWMLAGCDKSAFLDLLLDCEAYTPEVKPQAAELPLLRESADADRPLHHYDDLPQGFYDAIASRLHVKGYERNGWSKLLACPLHAHEHDDRQPGAAWHKDKHILSCFKCQRFEVLAVEVGEALGIDWRDFIDKHEKPGVSIGVTDEPPLPARPTIIRWQDAAQVVRLQASGEGLMPESLPIPFKNLHRFGGMAARLVRRKLLAIAGDSGDGKTSMTETIVDYWRQQGFSGLMWGPEWNAEEYVYRAVQRLGGPSVERMLEHLDWHAGRGRGETSDNLRGKPLDTDEADRLNYALDVVGRWPGALYFVDVAGIGATGLMREFDKAIGKAQAEGHEISFVAVDYAQLLTTGDDSKVEAAILELKDYVGNRNLAGIVGSQVRKQDGKGAADKQMRISHHSMQYLRSDKFNLVLAINRAVNEAGERSPYALIRVAKNNLGKTGDTGLVLDTERMRWGDMRMEHVDLSNFWHDFYGDPVENDA